MDKYSSGFWLVRNIKPQMASLIYHGIVEATWIKEQILTEPINQGINVGAQTSGEIAKFKGCVLLIILIKSLPIEVAE